MLKLMTTNNNHVNTDNASPGEYTYALGSLKLQHVQQGCQGLYNFSTIVNGNEYVVHEGETCSKSQRRSRKLESQHPALWTQGQKGKYKEKYEKS